MASAVVRDVIAQRVKILASALGKTFERSLQARENFQVFRGRLDGGINERLGFQIHMARFPKEAEGEPSVVAESFLAIDAAPRTRHGNDLLHAVTHWEVRKVKQRLPHSVGLRLS